MSEVAVHKREVRVIPQSKMQHTFAPLNSLVRRKVAGYARVSTDSDEQENSYAAQVDYFTSYIKSHDDWTFIKVYTDEGISGVSTKRREGFNEMIADALAGKIDLIVTKSVSRFARNTVDTLTTIRELKAHCIFNVTATAEIYTFDGKGELLLTIMSSLAQEESRSISENVAWGIRKSFSDGKVMMPYGAFLGYEKGEDGTPKVVPEEAEVVRTIYRRFMEGATPHQIAKELTERGVPTPRNGKKWGASTVLSILENERYKGEAILQKSFCTDFLTKKTKKNEGELPQYHVKDSHPAIVTSELWDQVQIEIGRRKVLGKHYSSGGVFACKVVCGDCGSFYGPKVWHSTDPYRTVIWRCNGKYATSESKRKRCSCPHIREEELIERFQSVLGRILARKPIIMATCEEAIRGILTFDDGRLTSLRQQAEGYSEKVRSLITLKAHAESDSNAFEKEYQKLTGQYERLVKRIETLEAEKSDREKRAKRIQLFMAALERQEESLEFDPMLFGIFVEKAVVSGTKKDVRVRFVLVDGSEWEG